MYLAKWTTTPNCKIFDKAKLLADFFFIALRQLVAPELPSLRADWIVERSRGIYTRRSWYPTGEAVISLADDRVRTAFRLYVLYLIGFKALADPDIIINVAARSRRFNGHGKRVFVSRLCNSLQDTYRPRAVSDAGSNTSSDFDFRCSG